MFYTKKTYQENIVLNNPSDLKIRDLFQANIVILAMVLNEICRLHSSGRTCTGDVVR